ncbi:class I SAM-dependent methyltransferase [Solirubrobacter phytolaccae]|uniref:Class I SAM-dependent methyltransferase n=1 Tax=Solirubrobacter phytolaccae TaxID=1404360 RepID=A0A9X3N747_9ACTN|nr:class I SAM-dependent methyltransferase [Solirubrobacter phytolaccae]MDA0180973.1 class I SAM-dependent methyltransferase [Solirubrobacter phytolaccae]
MSARLVDRIAPQPGHTILDLAAGLGDTGFLAAELIQPGGTLITSDFAPEMLTAAQRRAPANIDVRFKQIDLGAPIDIQAASVDGVLCRWGYMLLDDPEFALRETRRILKHDAPVALAAWTGPDDNLWSVLPVRILQNRGILDPDQPGPGQFAWANPNDIEDTMATAGFIEPSIEAVDFTMRYEDVDDWWVAQTKLSTRTADADARLDFATRSDVLAELEEAAQPFTQPDDSLIIPARTWVATATA